MFVHFHICKGNLTLKSESWVCDGETKFESNRMIIILQLIIHFNSVQAEFLFFQARGVLQNCSSDCSHDQSKKCANAKCTVSSAIKIAYLKEQKSVLFAITGDTGCSSKRTTATQTSVQFSSVTQSCPTLCDPMNCSTPGLPVHHQLPEFTQTHVHRVSDAIQNPPKKGLLVDWVF